MAWIRWRTNARGLRVATVQWRDSDGKVRSRALGTTDERVAEAHRQMVERKEEGKAAPSGIVDADTALRRFLAYVELTRKPATHRYYRNKLGPLWAAWSDRPMETWARPMLEAYVRAHPNWSPRQTQMLVGACKRFLSWSRETGVAAPDFVAGFRGPTVYRKAPTVLTADQLQALLATARGEPLEVRVALCGLLGLRKGESATVRVEDVDWRGKSVRVQGWKTHRDRVLPASEQLIEILQRRRPKRGLFWRGYEGNLTRDLKALCRRAGVPEITWHPLRHTFATIIARKHQLHVVQRLLGHQNLSTTGIYMHAQDEDLRAAVEEMAN